MRLIAVSIRTRGEKKHDVISMQSVVAELENDHLADGWNAVQHH